MWNLGTKVLILSEKCPSGFEEIVVYITKDVLL